MWRRAPKVIYALKQYVCVEERHPCTRFSPQQQVVLRNQSLASEAHRSLPFPSDLEVNWKQTGSEKSIWPLWLTSPSIWSVSISPLILILVLSVMVLSVICILVSGTICHDPILSDFRAKLQKVSRSLERARSALFNELQGLGRGLRCCWLV